MNDSRRQLSTPVEILAGVGPVVVRGLHKLGIETIRDLLLNFPRRWEDFSAVEHIASIRPGLVTVRARVLQLSSRRAMRNRRLTITEAILTDDTGTIKATWFNQPYILQQLKQGDEYLFAGEFVFRNQHLGMQNPTFEPAPSGEIPSRIVPIYSENKAISSKLLRKLIAQVIDVVDDMPDVLEGITFQSSIMSYPAAIRQLHIPTDIKTLDAAQERLALEELFFLVLTGLVLRAEIETEPGARIPFRLPVINKFLDNLNFSITTAQKKAAWSIFRDLDRDHPMNRLLEGDVGSGKTVVALSAAVMAIQSGFQAALMVPTEILARQHANSVAKLLKGLNITSDLLVSSLKQSEKKAIHTALADGSTQLVIGTHALLSAGVDFSRLGLVIIDEQHRFGVNQRRELRGKAEVMPHLLSMTATPIPRSLALVIYGDLDISVIDELPPGRRPVATELVEDRERTRVYQHIDSLIEEGRQVFVVCPLIDPSDKSGMKSVSSEYERLSQGVFSHRRIGLVHGRLKALEKSQTMADFTAGKLDMLVATSVIEVGVDVPNASVMIIEAADRFGLAALHQLRGRVGRGTEQSFCYLFTDSDNPAVFNRLRSLERTSDGFRLAQIDLELRGPGEIYGTTQHGQLDLRLSSMLDSRLIERAKAEAQAFLSSGNMLKYPAIVERINRLKNVTSLD